MSGGDELWSGFNGQLSRWNGQLSSLLGVPPDRLGLATCFYLAIEGSWQTGLALACWRLRPMAALLRQPAMRDRIGRAAGWLGQRARWEQLSQGGLPPVKRTLAEWVLLNKLVGVPLFPAKLALAASMARDTSPGYDGTPPGAPELAERTNPITPKKADCMHQSTER